MIGEIDMEKIRNIKFNCAKHLFKLGYYKIIDIEPFDPENRPIDFPFRFQATVKYRESLSYEYPSETEQVRRINPLLNVVAKHNLFRLGIGKPEKSLKYLKKNCIFGGN